MFVFNGVERLTGASHELVPYGFTSPAGPLRLLGSGQPHYGSLIGFELLAALALLIAAAALSLRDLDRRPRVPVPEPATPTGRAARRLVASLLVWLATAYVLFSFMSHLQPRYLEAMSPAVAAVLGIATAYLLVRLAGMRRLRLALIAIVSLALLAGPAEASINLVEERTSDANPSGSGSQFSAYLRAHQDGARYEAAAANPLSVVGLIAQDAQPVLVLRSIDGLLVSVNELRRLVREGAVRFVILPHPCSGGRHCAPTIAWSVHNSVKVHPGLYRYRSPGLLR
jgi:hypothetical protein